MIDIDSLSKNNTVYMYTLSKGLLFICTQMKETRKWEYLVAGRPRLAPGRGRFYCAWSMLSAEEASSTSVGSSQRLTACESRPTYALFYSIHIDVRRSTPEWCWFCLNYFFKMNKYIFFKCTFLTKHRQSKKTISFFLHKQF